MINLFRNFINNIFTILKLKKKDKLRSFPIDILKKVYCWRRGFLPESYVIYNFKNNDSNQYLSDFSRASKSSKINGTYSAVIDYKHLFAKHFKYNKIHIPLFYIDNGIIMEYDSGVVVEISKISNYLKNTGDLVIKPSGGGGGTDIVFLSFKESNWIYDGQLKTEKECENILLNLKKTLVYNKAIQSGFASKVNPDTLNTIRILTMIDPENNEVFIASAIFRCGTERSNGVDNWSRGGLSAKIDIDSGKMNKAVSFPYNGNLKWYNKHPNSQFKIEGFIIPQWEKIKQEILEVSKQHFYIPYIGWDVVPDGEDYFILEANSNCDVNLLQVHEPLLKHPRIRAFYEYYKVI